MMKVFCYAQHCSSRNGEIVPVSVIEQWAGENPERWEDGDYCDDWNLICDGSEDEIVDYCRAAIDVGLSAKPYNSNHAFAVRQLRNVLGMFNRPDTPARMIDTQAYTDQSLIVFIGEEIEREDLESDSPDKVADLVEWYPYTKVWKITDGEDETFYAVA